MALVHLILNIKTVINILEIYNNYFLLKLLSLYSIVDSFLNTGIQLNQLIMFISNEYLFILIVICTKKIYKNRGVSNK